MSTGIGEALRAAREEQGRDLQDAARVLRVRTDYLRALEDEEFGVFGGDIYAKGFLRSYATELGLDPEPLLDVYRSEVSDEESQPTPLVASGAATRPSPRRPLPGWVAWLAVAVVVLAGLAVLGLLGDPTPERAEREDVAPPPPAEENENADDEEPEEEPDDGPEPEDEPDEAPIEGVEVLLAFEERSWMRVVIDGGVVTEETVESGEVREYDGEEEIEIRFGNAGGVRVEHNGEDLGTAGTRGQPRTVTFTEERAEDADGEEL